MLWEHQEVWKGANGLIKHKQKKDEVAVAQSAGSQVKPGEDKTWDVFVVAGG